MSSTMMASSRGLGLQTEVLPAIYYSDLNSNSSRYDRIIASPSDNVRYLMWSFWVAITIFSVIVTTTVFLALLRSPTAKKNTFNLYLMAIILPDTLFSLNCAITCLTNRLAETFTSEAMCEYQAFYFTAAVCANTYMNAVVARELYTMLSCARFFRHYKPPTRRRVFLTALSVYFFACCLAAVILLHHIVPNFPFRARLMVGVACLPVDFDRTSSFVFYLVYLPIVIGFPMIYVLWILYKIVVSDKLIPPTGKRRVLFICFFQLVLTFFVMWVPAAILIFITGQWTNPWVGWFGGTWTHLQGPLSVLLLLLKPDVGEAVKQFLGLSQPAAAADEKDGNPYSLHGEFKSSVSTKASVLNCLPPSGTMSAEMKFIEEQNAQMMEEGKKKDDVQTKQSDDGGVQTKEVKETRSEEPEDSEAGSAFFDEG